MLQYNEYRVMYFVHEGLPIITKLHNLIVASLLLLYPTPSLVKKPLFMLLDSSVLTSQSGQIHSIFNSD